MLQIPDGHPNPLNIVIEVTQALVALVAQQPSHALATRPATRAAGSIVVHGETAPILRHSIADGARSALFPEHALIDFDGHVENALEVILFATVLHCGPLGLASRR